MDRENSLPRQNVPGLSPENTDTATPRDRIGSALRDRMFREEDGIFSEEITPSFYRFNDELPQREGSFLPRESYKDSPVTRRRLLRQIQNYSLALAQASLYSDAHPHDRDVLNYYNRCRAHLTNAVKMYEERYGTLSALPLEL